MNLSLELGSVAFLIKGENMDDQEKVAYYSRIFRGYVSDISTYHSAPAFTIHLKSMRKTHEEETEQTPFSQRDFKIRAICIREYRHKDGSNEIDRTLKDSLLPSIHIGNLIEFKGFGYRPPRYSSEDINFVEPKNLRQTDLIQMDRHYIRIMPPNKESVTRYDAHITTEKNKLKKRERWHRKWYWKSWIQNRIEDAKEHWVAITLTFIAIIAGFIIAMIFKE